ncbi:MAG: hypothetical protein NTU88_10140, partial [Armatimonadetes bacterium]|nr:hypothetical protein [Armatimonadota bacterium]
MREITEKIETCRSRNAATVPRKAFFWIVALVVALLCVHVYRMHTAKVAIRNLMRRDTTVMENMLSALFAGSVNYADLFQKVVENTKSRETVIRDMEMLNPYV